MAKATKKYLDYLKSLEWDKKRQKVLMRDKFRCVHCCATRALQVHHKTYARLYDELLEDLITLCKKCHRTEHGLKTRPKDHVPRIRSMSETRFEQRLKNPKKKKRKKGRKPPSKKRVKN